MSRRGRGVKTGRESSTGSCSSKNSGGSRRTGAFLCKSKESPALLQTVFGLSLGSGLFAGDLAQQVDVRQHLPCAEDHRGERVFGDEDRQSGFIPQALVEV